MIAKRYRTMPQNVTAMQFTTNNEKDSPTMDAIVNWCNQGKNEMVAWHNGTDIYVRVPITDANASSVNGNGEQRATVGDWIVRDSSVVFSVCKPDIFDATYEQAP